MLISFVSFISFNFILTWSFAVPRVLSTSQNGKLRSREGK